MRNSNGNPVTLAAWQHALLMDWVQQTEAAVAPVAAVAAAQPSASPPSMPRFAARRRDRVLARLRRADRR
jgi:hypothetical protein